MLLRRSTFTTMSVRVVWYCSKSRPSPTDPKTTNPVCTSRAHVEMRSPLPFPCVPDRPSKILLVQVGTLSFSHPSFGVPVLFIYLCAREFCCKILLKNGRQEILLRKTHTIHNISFSHPSLDCFFFSLLHCNTYVSSSPRRSPRRPAPEVRIRAGLVPRDGRLSGRGRRPLRR